MVLKSLNLARQSLAKTFTHGYAQSVVAASQSSYASQNHPFGTLHSSFANRFAGKTTGALQHQNAFQGAAAQSAAGRDASKDSDSGLAAYYAAWQKQKSVGEWSQYQFTKRIEWQAPAAVADGKPMIQESSTTEDVSTELKPAKAPVERAYSASAVDDFKKAIGSEEAEAAAIAKVDEAIAEEIARVAKQDAVTVGQGATDATARRSATPLSQLSTESLTLSDLTKASSVSLPDSYAEQLNKLAEQQQYAEIPAVFEHMLAQSISPTASAYNALLVATLNLTRGRHQVVPKALDVYSHMLRQRVAPDTTTYSILIELLSTRALDVLASREQLEERRRRYGGMDEAGRFMFRSNDTEFEILAEDDSLSLALKLFRSAMASATVKPFAETTYRALITACAEAGKVDEMVNIYSYMEAERITPQGEMFVPMISAFGASGDLRSAVECYEEYKALAISHDKGEVELSRQDESVYASLISAYEACRRSEAGKRFTNKLVSASADEAQAERLTDSIALRAVIPELLKQNSFAAALLVAEEKLSSQARDTGMSDICIAAADRSSVVEATEAYAKLSDAADVTLPAFAMAAMLVRTGNLTAAADFWKVVERAPLQAESLEAATMQTVALIGSGHSDTALRQCRDTFERLRAAHTSEQARTDITEQLDEAIDSIGQFVSKRGLVLPVKSSLELMWIMVENGGLVTPVASHLLAGIGPETVAHLGWEDLNLLFQVQAGMIMNASHIDIAHDARFAHLFEFVLRSGMTINKDTEALIEQVLPKLGRADLSQRWQHYRYPVAPAAYPAAVYSGYTASATPSSFEDSYDPYAATTDNKGSVAITDLLDKAHGKSSAHLNEALTKFKNMRRAGRHPRFFTYAKLISAAAREGRLPLAHDILALAKQDVPYQPQYRIVRFGWVSILDSMVAACLTTGQRKQAAQFHQELLDMGAAPSANTFGLYITTLKESTKTFDEASEAVKIFIRAKTEGVEPSSFLYNALIGKLGKARRIDDCLFYFTEMRNLGIRPTSVTYGTIVNALCRVSDEKFAEELFEEMESMPNYKPRPAPYHSMMQFFLSTKRDRSKVLDYYHRMRAKNIQPTTHTYKLLIDTHATLEPVDMSAAQAVLEQIRAVGDVPEAVHYSSLIHAKGCVMHDMEGARKTFDEVLADPRIRPQACLYQALFEAMVANHLIEETTPLVADMKARGVEMTPYIANALIHGWATAKDSNKAERVYNSVPKEKREPSTYEAMTRAFMALEKRDRAMEVVNEGLSRGYPAAVANKILELVGGGHA